MSDRTVTLLIAACLVTAFGVPALVLGDLPLITTFHDDAFYYYQVARNLTAGNGFTFDGLHPTNGFHPLWLFTVVPVFAMADGLIAPLRAIGLLEAGLIAACGAVLFATLAPRVGRAPAAATALALGALPGARTILWSGLESALSLVLFLLIWNRSLALTGAPSRRSYLSVGALCALAMATRMEAILVLPALALAGLPGGLSRRGACWLALPSVAALGAVLAFNRVGFGTWIPISGIIKAHWASAAPDSYLDALVRLPWIGREITCRAFGAGDVQLCPTNGITTYFILEGLLLALCVMFRRGIARVVRRSGVFFLLLASALIVAADILAVKYPAPWYCGPILLCTAIAVGLTLVHAMPRAAEAVCILLSAVALGRATMYVAAPRDPMGRYAAYRVEAARWLAANTSRDERIGSWNAGMIGYFSGRHVVNLDGLANGLDYYHRVTQGHDLEGYLESERIGWLADQACGLSPRPIIYLRRTRSEHLDDRFELTRAFYNAGTADHCPGSAVWRMR